MNQTIVVIGGCRSGKSRYALELAEGISPTGRLFVATSVPEDAEMMDRVRRHREERGPDWNTLEEPVRLAEALAAHAPDSGVILVDCVTLWISNLMLQTDDIGAIQGRIHQLCLCLASACCPVVLVTNEVGGGIVPENRLARHFRDLVGFANQTVAAGADRVVWMVAGIPVVIKGKRGDQGV